MMLLELTDHTGQIECVLYDEYVDQLHDYLKSNSIQTQVVVFQFAGMMPFEPALFGTSVIRVIPTVTKLLFNPPAVEVFDLYDWRTIRELCLNSDVGCYVILATVIAMVVNEDWRHLYSSVKPKANERFEFGVSPYDGYLIPRYNVKADVFDGVESRGFYLNDYHVMNYLTKFASQVHLY
ncbi:hypothetical protein SESBI_30774 [Sesbania bispinosa]|nr:hypothetical protein SESBI_30774 [Sesbania bispinosa]